MATSRDRYMAYPPNTSPKAYAEYRSRTNPAISLKHMPSWRKATTTRQPTIQPAMDYPPAYTPNPTYPPNALHRGNETGQPLAPATYLQAVEAQRRPQANSQPQGVYPMSVQPQDRGMSSPGDCGACGGLDPTCACELCCLLGNINC
jgi:hypothetical protein